MRHYVDLEASANMFLIINWCLTYNICLIKSKEMDAVTVITAYCYNTTRLEKHIYWGGKKSETDTHLLACLCTAVPWAIMSLISHDKQHPTLSIPQWDTIKGNLECWGKRHFQDCSFISQNRSVTPEASLWSDANIALISTARSHLWLTPTSIWAMGHPMQADSTGVPPHPSSQNCWVV